MTRDRSYGRRRAVEPGPAAQGYSLIEVLVAMAVASLVVLLLFATVGFSNVIWRRGSADIEVQRMARLAIDIMAAALREASAHPDHLKVWTYEVRGRRQGAIGFLTARGEGGVFQAPDGEARWQYAIYYVYDAALRQIRKITDDLPLQEPFLVSGRGLLLAWSIESLAFEVDGDLITIVVVAESNGRRARMQTQVRPRN